MEPEKIRALAVLLGTTPEKLSLSLDMLEKEEEQRGMEGFYYNPDVFAKLHSIDCEGLRKLVMPNLSKLRR